MKITDVSITFFPWDDIPATSYGEHKKFGGSSQLGLLAIVTDDGITGHAFLGSSRQAADTDAPGLIRYLKPVLMGQDSFARERLYQALWKRARTSTTRAVGAIDVALWDIAGKAADLPIHKLLGLFRERAPAYASSQILPSPTAYVEQALHYKALNWPAYNIHPPQNWREDIRVCEAVRKAVGDDVTVMVDPGWCYSYEGAARRLCPRRPEVPLVRRSARRSGYLQLRQVEARAQNPDYGHRVSADGTGFLRAVDDDAGNRFSAR